MTNILKAIHNISELNSFELSAHYKNTIRIQQVGDALEYFIKDAFCSSVYLNDIAKKEEKYAEEFSYLGNANNPPDIMIKNGDAIEVKKIEGAASTISLNSSYPKHKLYADSSLITKACRECEDWQEKDIIYAIGTVKENNLRSLWLVYGSVYAADKEVYERISGSISSGLQSVAGVEFSPTNELGRVNKVDPLGITYLRVRGMWGIEHPAKVFSSAVSDAYSLLNVVIPEEKYFSFPAEDRKKLDANKQIITKKISVKNPNNPVGFIPAFHISFKGNK